jgi:hypothetical protein
MYNLIETCKVVLSIKNPVKIELKDRIFQGNMGVHWVEMRAGVIKTHIIKVALPLLVYSGRSLEEVIAHEFIHAWQAENNRLYDKVCHGEDFQEKAAELTKILGDNGYTVPNIFNSVDLEAETIYR